MTTSLYSLNPLSYGNYVAQGSGKLYVPVNSHYVGYAQFDHVSGISAQHGQQGVPVNRLSILNTLIDRVLSVSSGKSEAVSISKEDVSGLTDTQLDAMISTVQAQMKDAVKTAAFVPYGLAGAVPLTTGAVFSLVV
ncbi:MAG: hypothetical protein II811_03605 [Spirochaetaceae bacterium]|nr:hypothetical protein [Spirochaetaceae bacterium]